MKKEEQKCDDAGGVEGVAEECRDPVPCDASHYKPPGRPVYEGHFQNRFPEVVAVSQAA